MTDNRLLDRYIHGGSQAAFAELTKRYMGMVYATCRRDLANQQMAEDATQAVFVLLAKKAPFLRPNVSLGGWLFMAARNVSRDMLRAERTRKRYEGEAATMSDGSHERKSGWSEIECAVNNALSSLRPPDRDIILKRYFEGLSIRELALEAGTTEDSAAKRLSRAIERLRRYFKGQEVIVTSTGLAALLLEHAILPVPHSVASAVGQVWQASINPGAALPVELHFHISLLTKGIAAMSIAKIAGVTTALVLAVLLAAFVIHRQHHLSTTSPNQTVQWAVAPSIDPATLAEQRQIQAEYVRYMDGWNAYSATKILATLSPNFTMINGGSLQSYEQFASFLRSALASTPPGRSTTAKITSCRITGNTAVLSVQEFHYSSPTDQPFNGDSDTITVTLVNTADKWLIERIGP